MRQLFALGLLYGGLFAEVSANSAVVSPYLVTLKAREANVRVGPGSRYPLAWKFVRSEIPLMVLAEVGTWRKIRDSEGAEGWVHQNMIANRRTILVVGQTRSLMKKPKADASIVAHIEPDVCARLLEIYGDWVRIKADGFTGWLLRAHIWGIPQHEKNRKF
ncbi:MAG: hypothetical protein LBH38_01125 [Holosporales bacterium]|jgi:SH3-like domain-containing protein|nr:hypothetical protein [Holosporales bacterium]